MIAGEPWYCKRCKTKVLAVIVENGHGLRPVFDGDMLPSLIRDHAAYIVVECPECGEERRWYKRGIMQSGEDNHD